MQQHSKLDNKTKIFTLPKKNEKKYEAQAVEAAGYLHELLTDAIDYTPGQLQYLDEVLALEVKTNLGTKFSVNFYFNKSELQLRANFPSGIVQTEYAKIRHFLEDLECYLNTAHQW